LTALKLIDVFTDDMDKAKDGQSGVSITDLQNHAAGQREVGRTGGASLHSLTSRKQDSINLRTQTL